MYTGDMKYLLCSHLKHITSVKDTWILRFTDITNCDCLSDFCEILNISQLSELLKILIITVRCHDRIKFPTFSYNIFRKDIDKSMNTFASSYKKILFSTLIFFTFETLPSFKRDPDVFHFILSDRNWNKLKSNEIENSKIKWHNVLLRLQMSNDTSEGLKFSFELHFDI